MNVGIDMVNIKRFDDYLRIKDKIFSVNELKIYQEYQNKKLYVASRFCLKEAFLKSMHKGVLDVDLNLIEVLKNANGSVFISYLGKNYSCSLSHEDDYCIGVAIYE